MPEINGYSFRLIALGSPRLEIRETASDSLRAIGPGKNLAILAYLALAPGRTTTRDRLCDLLWGDRDLSRSRPQLRQTLWLIRSQIDAEIVLIHKDRVSLNPRVAFDVEDFLAAVRENNFHRALQIYGGDFFSAFASPGSANFEEWASLERTRLRRMFVSCAESVMKAGLDAGHFGHALEIAKRVRELEPDGQTGWRMLIEARLASGDRIGAQGDAKQLEEWLAREEWKAEPGTRAILDAVKSRETSPDEERAPGEVIAELTGRGREFAQIHDAWMDARRKGARFIHLTAPSGMGKTRLLRDVCARIRSEGGRTRYVRANFGERSIPFSFAAAIASALATAPGAGGIAPETARTLVSLDPALSSRFVASTEKMEQLDSRRVGLALLELIRAIADEDPIAIGLDDFQWSDPYTRDALGLVVSRLKSECVLFLTASRPNYGLPVVDHTQMLRLPPLTIDDVTQLLASLGQLPAAPWVSEFAAALTSATGGVPLLIVEAIRSCLERGLLRRTDSEWQTDDHAALIQSLSGSGTRMRFKQLPERGRQLLLLLSIAGTPLDRAIARRVMGSSELQMEEDVQVLEHGGFVVSEDSSLLVAHDSISEALISSTSEEVVKDYNRRIGEALAESADTGQKRRAISHLLHGDSVELASEVAAPFVGARPRGASVRDSIASLVGTASAESAEVIERRLPLSVRRPGLKRQVVIASAVVAAALILSLRPFIDRDPVGSGVTVRLLSGDAHNPVLSKPVDLQSDDWAAQIDRLDSGKRYRTQGHLVPRPGYEEWAEHLPFPDSGAGDVALVRPGKPLVRLTSSRGEDAPASFSPDGSKLLILTTRWNSNGWYDLIAMDITTRAIERLTFDSARYISAKWSPDGSRIATSSTYAGAPRICVMNIDRSNRWCMQGTAAGAFKGLAGWFDPYRLIFNVQTGNQARWFLWDTRTYDLAPTAIPPLSDPVVGPFGKWASTVEEGGSGSSVGPVVQDARTGATSSRHVTSLPLFFVRRPELYSDSVAIVAPSSLVRGVPLQLRLAAWRKNGASSEVPVVLWRSLIPAMATIDSFGIVTGMRTGTATIEASLGGWRKATARIDVEPPASKVAMTDDWSGDPWKRWRPFGNPMPRVTDFEGKKTFLVNGDDAYFSGAYTVRDFDATKGIAVDLDISAPVNRMQWQLIHAGVMQVSNRNGLDDWDHRTGYISGFVAENGCHHSFPHGEGDDAINGIDWLPGLRSALGDEPRLEDGKWHRVRLQYFPDGRCGLAVNGHAVRVTGGPPSPAKRLVPYIQGMSVGTEIRVASVVVYEGIPSDVDWKPLTRQGWRWLR